MVNTWTSPYGLPSGEVIRIKTDNTFPSTYEGSEDEDLIPPPE
jgi:hypothetical protein